MREAHFSFDSPLSLLRYVRHLLLSERIEISGLDIHPETLYKMLSDKGALQHVQTSFSGENNKVLGIPFKQRRVGG